MKRYISADKELPRYYAIPMHEYLGWMFSDEYGGANLENVFNLEYHPTDESGNFDDSRDVQINFLVSRGFDTASKIDALIRAWRAGVDVVPLIEEGFSGSAADLKRLVNDTRKSNYSQHQQDILQKYDEYWDESQSAYVLDTDNSKQLAEELVSDLEKFKYFRYGSKKPSYSKKYITPGKYYKVYVHWD